MARFGRRGFSSRLLAMIAKEFKQMRRDRPTFAIMIGVPLMQIVLFGYAIDLDPRQLPTAVVSTDTGPMGRSLIAGLQLSRYFQVTHRVRSGTQMERLLQAGKVQFGVEIPSDFSKRVARGEGAQLLVAADDSDPAAVGSALGAIERIAREAIERELRGGLANRRERAPPVDVVAHRRTNPEITTQKIIVPGLLGVVLLLSLMVNTSLAVTRERERGTMEQLLSMPLRPVEIMLGKILPYITIGVVQAVIVLTAAFTLFEVPMRGSPWLLAGMIALFILATLTAGYLISTVARTQLQAMEMTIFFFLPNLLLSGFAFPFRGMPGWAQAIGEIMPLTHFVRVVRGVLLKGAGVDVLWPAVAVLTAFTGVVIGLALLRFRRTLE